MRRRHHAAGLLGLLCLAASVQALVIGRAAVPSLDAVRFVRSAQAIADAGPSAAPRTGPDQPLFPLWVAAVHAAFASLSGESPSLWATSVQAAAAIPLVLTLVPLYLLLARLFAPPVPIVGSVLFCILPEVTRLGADGISDSTHLLFFTAALWTLVETLHHAAGLHPSALNPTPPARVPLPGRTPPSTRTFTSDFDGVRPSSAAPPHSAAPCYLALSGLFAALAVLTRAEAVLLPLALGLGLFTFWARRRSKPAFRTASTLAFAYALGLLLVLAPYLAWTAPATPQAAIACLLGRGQPSTAKPPATTSSSGPVHVAPPPRVTAESRARPEETDEPSWQTPDGRPLHFVVKEGSIRRRGFWAAVGQYGEELADVFGYWLGPLALWALWRHRRVLTRPADRILQLFFVVFSLAIVSFVAGEGYLSARHLLPLLIVGLGIAAVGTSDAIGLATRRFRPQSCGISTTALATVLTIVVSLHLFAATRPLRADRWAHRQAGDWLARHSPDGLSVLDTRGWTALYSARPTYQYDRAKTAVRDPRLGYVVIEPRELDYPTDRARTLHYLLAAAGEPAAQFGQPSGDSTSAVAVYRWRPDQFQTALRAIIAQPPSIRVHLCSSVVSVPSRPLRPPW